MLTYNKDIYQHILKPLSIQNYITDYNYGKYSKPKSNETVWDMMFPQIMKEEMQVASFTGFNMGKDDSKNGADGKRKDVKNHLISRGNQYYPAMKEHIRNMVSENASIMAYENITKKKLKFNDLTKNKLEEFVKANPEAIQDAITQMTCQLSGYFNEHQKEIIDDERMPQKLKDYIVECIFEDPLEILEILIFLSLFSRNDKDRDFFEEFARHYCYGDGSEDGGGTKRKRGFHGSLLLEGSKRINDELIKKKKSDSRLFVDVEEVKA